MKYTIGIDLGTSATKALLMDEQGVIVDSKSYKYPMYEPENGWAEQDPKDWENAVLTLLRQLVSDADIPKENITGIGLSGQMHGLVMLDESNQLLRNSIIWCDQRAGKQREEMLELFSPEEWMKYTANPPIAGWTAAKILWVKENQPELFQKCKHILLPKDYIVYILTGKYSTDVSDASGMQIFDVKKRNWSDEVLEKLDLPKSLFGEVHESQEVVGTLLPQLAKTCGLLEDTLVVAGGSDNACAAIGTGTIREGEAFISLGTSAVVYTHLDQFAQTKDGGIHLCCSAVPGCWQNEKDFYEFLTESVTQIPVGSDKLIFLPFLMGERTPHMNSWYRGAFLGVNTVHTQAHFLRSIMEGVAFCLADCNDKLKNLGVNVSILRACGGGAKNSEWLRMIAALFKCDICTLKQEEGPAFGAAVLAGVGSGVFSSIYDACDRFISEKNRYACEDKIFREYEKLHIIYDKAYDSLKDCFWTLYECEL